MDSRRHSTAGCSDALHECSDALHDNYMNLTNLHISSYREATVMKFGQKISDCGRIP